MGRLEVTECTPSVTQFRTQPLQRGATLIFKETTSEEQLSPLPRRGRGPRAESAEVLSESNLHPSSCPQVLLPLARTQEKAEPQAAAACPGLVSPTPVFQACGLLVGLFAF